jgi:hypothetical protein
MKDVKRFNNYQEFLNEALDPLTHLTQEQVDWCDKHISGRWGVNEKGEVTVSEDLYFKAKSFERFPVQFANVKGFFSCGGCTKLVSLEGAPQKVNGEFNCSWCPNLVSLEGAPKEVGEDFSCDYCPKLPKWETDLIEDYNKKRRTWEEVYKILHKETYRRAAQTGLI